MNPVSDYKESPEEKLLQTTRKWRHFSDRVIRLGLEFLAILKGYVKNYTLYASILESSVLVIQTMGVGSSS
jgi:hypothetical protein